MELKHALKHLQGQNKVHASAYVGLGRWAWKSQEVGHPVVLRKKGKPCRTRQRESMPIPGRAGGQDPRAPLLSCLSSLYKSLESGDMRIFKSLISSRHLLLPRWSSLLPAARWHGISEALPHAFRCLGSKRSGASAAWSSHAHDGGESVPWPPRGQEPTLPPDHPYTIRVRRIATNIIAAACDDQTYAGRWGLLQRIRRPFDGVDWRVEVFDSDYVDAYCYDDGQIRLSNALVRTQSEADIAATLGHEARYNLLIVSHAHTLLAAKLTGCARRLGM